MNAVDRAWEELKQASSARGDAGPLPLSSFQFPKKKPKCPMHGKVSNAHQSLAALSSSKHSSALDAQKGCTEQGGEAEFASPAEKVYRLDCWQFVASTVQRQVNILKEECNGAKRYGALAMLKHLFLEASVPNVFYNRAFTVVLDPLLLCLSEPSETARHMAACLLLKFLTEVAEVDEALGDVLRGLVPRFGSRDIEGVAQLPHIMRPTPEYKPLQLVPIEKSEEVRQTLLQVLQTVLNRTSDKYVWNHLDLITGLIRAATMDIFHDIKFVALQTVVEFFDRHQNMLLHFTEPVARSILSCLVHQHARIRMGALRALTHVLASGLYKYSGEIIQMLAGWRDPNIVPIKALYEVTTVRNYFAELLADQSPMVRMFFFDTLARWLYEFKDKADYETWLVPYLLSGLFDPFRPIQQLVFRLLELLGKQYEATHEKDLRDIKQLGTPEAWSYGGKCCLTFPLGGYWDLPEEGKVREETDQFFSFVNTYTKSLQSLGFEGYSLSASQEERYAETGDALVGDPPRPCLGTRMMVRTYFRRYANTLFQRVDDFKEVTMAASARLMVVSFAFIEEACVEWLDNTLAICCQVLPALHHTSPEAIEAYKVAVRLVGAFVDPEIYWEFVKDALEESSLEEIHKRVAKIGVLALMLEGSFAVLQKTPDLTLGLGRLKPVLPKIAEALCYTELLQDLYVGFAADNVTKVLKVLIPGVVRQQETLSLTTWHHLLGVICSVASPGSIQLEADDSKYLAPDIQDLLDSLVRCNGFANRKLSAPKSVGSLWHFAKLSCGFPPANLAAVNACVRYLPYARIREEGTFDIIYAKLQELSAATQKAATRKGIRRTALRLIKRLILEGTSAGQSNDNNGNDSPTQLHSASVPSSACLNCDQAYLRGATEAFSDVDDPEQTVDTPEKIQNKLLNSPAQAAAKILSNILLNKLRQMDESCIDDLIDTLVALSEFLSLPQLSSNEIHNSLQETFETSRFITTVGQVLQDPSLHRRLFCLGCKEYAHECASRYPDKQPALVLEDMPLGKRRELRLSAIRAAAALKEHAVLLMRVSLPVVAKSFESLKYLVNALIGSLHPASKLQQLQEMRRRGKCDASWNQLCSFEAEICLDGASDQLRKDEFAPAEEKTGKVDSGGLHCASSLPCQPQSHWRLFHTASCLWDAINTVIACHSSFTDREPSTWATGKLPPYCYSQSLLMPRAWHLPEHGHLQREKAGRILLELCTESALSGAIDSCVRQIVELQESISADPVWCTEDLENNSRRCPEARLNLVQALNIAKNQINTVAPDIQKKQALLALMHVIRLLGSVSPSSIQECIRQYESSGRFSRRAVLIRLFEEPATALADSLK
ncbi:hypothetical protein, conserved [Eimeria maxima]|uniref:HEAT repeat-containing protein n=1 Tax=Eimeria maxima TaxID=5804 RepID=U6M8R1_EIMMA|nr:hypothetical protein, conserved [Eimeria maxima]CDJ60426.1 hypothetical protein, conserved [Eimeria maxima]